MNRHAMLSFACVVIVCAVLLPTSAAEACLCGGLANPCANLWGYGGETPIVFEGTVESIGQHVVEQSFDGRPGQVFERRMLAVRFKDVRQVLGDADPVVLTGTGGGDCGYEKFRVGQRFVIHARRESEGLTTSTCSFTAPVDAAHDVLDYLAGLARPSPGGRVNGKVVLARRELVGLPSITSTALEDVRVVLDGPATRTAITDAAGGYAFNGLPPGRYRVMLSVDPARRLREQLPREFVLANAHACATPYAEFYADSTIEGTVVDVDGRPVPKAQVGLRAADIEGKEQVSYDTSVTDGSGRFAFGALGAGRYVVGVNIASGARDESPYALTLALDGSGRPEVIELEHGGRLQLAPIVVRVPPPAAVTGRLLLPDGRPATNTRVRAFSANERRTQFGATVESTTDADGRFALSLGLNQPYRISVYMESGPRVEHDLVAADGLDLTLRLVPRR